MKKLIWNGWIVGIITAVFCAASSPGDEPTGTRTAELKKLSIEQLMGLEVATVTTASKKEEKATAAPATVIVITATDIKLRGYRFLGDVLRDLPGLETAPMFFSEFGTQIAGRGVVGNNKIIVLVNGMRVNPPGGEDFPFRSDFSVRDAEQIEVIYGAGSTLYGADAISAVINIKTRKPTKTPGGVVGADGGLNGERDVWASFSDCFGVNKNIRFLGYLTYHDSEMSNIGKDYPSYWASYHAVAAATTPAGQESTPSREDFGLNIFARLEVSDWASLQVWHRQSERSSAEGGYGNTNNLGQYVPILNYLPEARWDDMSTVAEGKITLPIGDSAKLDSTITYNRYEIGPSTRYVWPDNASKWYLNDYKYGIGQGLTMEETLHWELTPKVSLLAGLSAGIYDIIPKSTVPGGANPDGDFVAQGGYWEYYTISNYPASLQQIPRVVRTCYQTYAGYVEVSWQMLEKLRLIAGTRLTKDTRFSELPLTPRAALIYDVTPELTAKYIFSRAFVAPAPYFAHATYDNGTALATSTPNINPETSMTHEINLTYNRTNFTVGVSGYYSTQDNLILPPDTAVAQYTFPTVWVGPTASDQRLLAHSVNSGTSESIGVDLYGRATFGPISTWASYSYVDFHENLPTGTIGLQGISHHNGRLGATWAVTGKLFVTPSLEIRSTPENVVPGTLGSALQTPYDINLYILFEMTKHVELFANLCNITDNHYALGGIAGIAYPQETFHGVIGVRVTW